MLTAQQFWTPAKRAEFNAFRQAPRYTAHWLPERFRRMPEARTTGAPVEEGGHTGFRFHEEWPDLTVKRACRKNGDRDASRVVDNFGWYTDSFMDDVIFACAVQIRVPRRQARREKVESESCYSEGQPTRVRWVEATQCTSESGVMIARRKPDIHDSMEDAIRGADRSAEIAAEEAREYDAKDQANQEISELKGEIKDRQEFIANCQEELKALCSSHEVARGILNDRIMMEQARIRKAEERIAALEKDFWLAVPQ